MSPLILCHKLPRPIRDHKAKTISELRDVVSKEWLIVLQLFLFLTLDTSGE